MIPIELSGEECVRFVDDFFSIVFRASVKSMQEFFDLLARTTQARFEADLVTIWDNTEYGQYLVLLASSPVREATQGSFAIPRASSLTGVTIETGAVAYHLDLAVASGSRAFANPGISDAHGLRRMISIPVFHPSDDGRVSCVVDLCFRLEFPTVARQERMLKWLAAAVALALDRLYLRTDDGIRRLVGSLTPVATGIAKLFEGLAPEILKLTQCTQTAIFRRDPDNKLVLVGSSDVDGPGPRPTQAMGSHDPVLPDVRQRVRAACMAKKKHFMACEEVRFAEGEMQKLRRHSYVLMATPLLSESGEVLGVLEGSLSERDGYGRSLSSVDVEVLDSFANSLSPLVQRFNRVRGGSTLVFSVLEKVTSAAIGTGPLDEVLRETIGTLAVSLNAERGCIYLFDEALKTQRLTLRASYGTGSGSGEHLSDRLAGELERGKIVNLKSFDHPNEAAEFEMPKKAPDGALPGRSSAFLAVPIMQENRFLGAWKLERLLSSEIHPEDYFTDEDEQIARIVSSFLAYVIEHGRRREATDREFKLLAQSSIEIENTKTEADAILAVIEALEASGWKNAILSLYHPDTRRLTGSLASKSVKPEVTDRIDVPVDGEDLLAVVLRNNRAEFISDSTVDPRCNASAIRAANIISQYVLPLRLDDELIGTLQVDMGRRSFLEEDERLVLNAFAGHLALAISRIRGMEKMLELTSQVMSGSRFIVAEALSGVVVHSLGHKLNLIVKQLETDLGRKEVREREALLSMLSQWHEILKEGQTDLNSALQLVKGDAADADRVLSQLQPLIQESINMWITLLKAHKCKVESTLGATKSTCAISPHVFREIMSVLIVNSVQAYAKCIDIKTFNEDRVHIGANFIRTAFCVDFSDDGVGLLTDAPEQIFAATYTTKPEKFGTGLGLFIARRLARDAGGELVVIPARAKGVTFRLGLPTV